MSDVQKLWPLELNKEMTINVKRGDEVYSWNFRVTSEQSVMVAGQKYDAYLVQAVQTPVLVQDPKKIRGALDEARAHPGPALVNVVISQGATRKAQEFKWHS